MCNNARRIQSQQQRDADAARWPHIENPRELNTYEERLDIYEQALAGAAREYARFRPGEPCPFRLFCANGGASLLARGAIVAPWMDTHHKIHSTLGFLVCGMRAVADATPAPGA